MARSFAVFQLYCLCFLRLYIFSVNSFVIMTSYWSEIMFMLPYSQTVWKSDYVKHFWPFIRWFTWCGKAPCLHIRWLMCSERVSIIHRYSASLVCCCKTWLKATLNLFRRWWMHRPCDSCWTKEGSLILSLKGFWSTLLFMLSIFMCWLLCKRVLILLLVRPDWRNCCWLWR